jgi:hypothetical protein
MPEPAEPAVPAAPIPAPAPADDRAAQIAAIIRNGLSNGPIAQSQSTWDHLQTRLGEIARAILQEL